MPRSAVCERFEEGNVGRREAALPVEEPGLGVEAGVKAHRGSMRSVRVSSSVLHDMVSEL